MSKAFVGLPRENLAIRTSGATHTRIRIAQVIAFAGAFCQAVVGQQSDTARAVQARAVQY